MSRDVAAAEARAAAARAQLTTTVETLQAHLSPERLGQRALAEVKGGGARVARASADVVRRRPGVVAGTLAVAVLLLARKRLLAAVRGETPATKPALETRVPLILPAPAKRIRS